MGKSYSCDVLPSDYRFRREPGGLTIYKPVITVRRTSQPPEHAVEGFLIRRWGSYEEVIKTTSSGGGPREASQGDDDMVLNEGMFTVVKKVARELRMELSHVYDKQCRSKTAKENGGY